MYKSVMKRILDMMIASLAILFFAPLMIVLAIIIKIKLGSPIIFKQSRPGLNNKLFTMYKFRSMTNKKNHKGVLLSDSLRLTRFGKFLRSTSMDELPEFFNVFKGEMSVVGPRPQLIKDIVFMDENQKKRQLIKPGITGLAQVNGRNAISWEMKIEDDLKYIDSMSFIKDVIIIVKTVFKVVQRKDVNYENMDTAPDFGDYLLETKQIELDEYQRKIQLARKLENEKNTTKR